VGSDGPERESGTCNGRPHWEGEPCDVSAETPTGNMKRCGGLSANVGRPAICISGAFMQKRLHCGRFDLLADQITLRTKPSDSPVNSLLADTPRTCGVPQCLICAKETVLLHFTGVSVRFPRGRSLKKIFRQRPRDFRLQQSHRTRQINASHQRRSRRDEARRLLEVVGLNLTVTERRKRPTIDDLRAERRR